MAVHRQVVLRPGTVAGRVYPGVQVPGVAGGVPRDPPPLRPAIRGPLAVRKPCRIAPFLVNIGHPWSRVIP